MKRLVILSAVAVLSLATVGYAVLNSSDEEPQKAPQKAQTAMTFDSEVKESPKAVEEKAIEEKVEEVENVGVVTETVPNETSILPNEQPQTLLSYAKTQLDLSTPELENCFNMIVQEYPERFNGSEAHRNVRALRGYANVCTSGIMSKNQGNIYIWDIGKGYKGAYFDSDIANASL